MVTKAGNSHTPKGDRDLEHLCLIAYFEQDPANLAGLAQACWTIAYELLGEVHGSGHVIPTLTEEERLAYVATPPPRPFFGTKFRGRLIRDSSGFVQMLEVNRPRFTLESTPRGSVDKFAEALWWLSYVPEPVYNGVRLPPVLAMHLGLDRMTEEQIGRSVGVCERFAEAVTSEPSFGYGLFDVAEEGCTAAGLYYDGSAFPGWVRFQRQLNYDVWVAEGAQRSGRARGVYWGNIFGPAMVARLGGADELITGYQEQWKYRGKQDGIATALGGGSVLLALSSRIASARRCSPAMTPSVFSNAVWLHNRLSRAGLLACG